MALKQHPIDNVKDVYQKLDKLLVAADWEITEANERLKEAKKKFNELGRALDVLRVSESTGTVDTKTLNIIKKYLGE